MAGQEPAPGDCSMLLNGLLHQHEHEHANQQHDGQPFSKQTSASKRSNRLSRKLSRRTSGLEQDLSISEHKSVDAEKQLLDCQKENTKLQQELLEVNLFKNKLADLLKRENEEKAKLEKQQSAFQNQAFTAICERDRLLSEVEKLQAKEDEMTEKTSNLQDRLDQIEFRHAQEKSLCTNLQKELEKSNQDVVLYRKVIEKFWKVRVKAGDAYDSERCEERAVTLLVEDEGYWSYKDQNKLHFDEACLARESLANLRQEFDLCHSSLERCQAEYCEESRARKHLENTFIQYRQQLVDLTDQLTYELQQLSSLRTSLKKDVLAFLCEQTNWILSSQEALQHIFKEKAKTTGSRTLPEVNEVLDNHNESCCSKEYPSVHNLRIGRLENGNNVYDMDDNITLDKDDLSVTTDSSPKMAIGVARDDELASSRTHNDINDLTNTISSQHKDADTFQEDDLSDKHNATDVESLTIATDDSKEALDSQSITQMLHDLSGKQDATDDERLAVAMDDSQATPAQALQDDDLNGQHHTATAGECSTVATDDSQEFLNSQFLTKALQDLSGKQDATDDECLTHADESKALARALQEKDDDMSGKHNATDGECLALTTDDSKEVFDSNTRTQALHNLSGKQNATDGECLTVFATDDSKEALAQALQDGEFLTVVATDDSKEALAQALQEKVAALLLLSQQEERHILESNNVAALESEISSLKQQLQQVTSQKVGALVELAHVHEELRKLQDASNQATHYSPSLSSGQATPVENYNVSSDTVSISMAAENAKKAPMQGYLKQLWQKRPELGGRTKSLSHMLTFRPGKESDAVGIARLRVENATLRESLGSIRHLCKSANRLRLTIARVAADSNAQTEGTTRAAVEAVDGVIAEALHLKVALHSSLPMDDLGWNSIGSPLTRASEGDPGTSDYDANDDLHIVCFFGLEIVRLVLLAAQLQKRCLGQHS